jgi:hypothetical protein
MSGNGGWTSGHLAQLVDEALEGGAVTVRLRTPPPLDVEMAISRGDDGTVEIWDGRTLVAQADAAEPMDVTDVRAPVTHEQAVATGPAYEGLRSHPFPHLFHLRNRSRPRRRAVPAHRPAGRAEDAARRSLDTAGVDPGAGLGGAGLPRRLGLRHSRT